VLWGGGGVRERAHITIKSRTSTIGDSGSERDKV
jgi:hypothetical protein